MCKCVYVVVVGVEHDFGVDSLLMWYILRIISVIDQKGLKSRQFPLSCYAFCGHSLMAPT